MTCHHFGPSTNVPDRPETRTVELLHALPDAPEHVDWMLERDATAPLVTFRAPRRVALLEPGAAIDLERIGDHRRRYLDYEGPLSGDRGSVRRLGAGRVMSWTGGDVRWALVIDWGGGDARYVVEWVEGVRWCVRREG